MRVGATLRNLSLGVAAASFLFAGAAFAQSSDLRLSSHTAVRKGKGAIRTGRPPLPPRMAGSAAYSAALVVPLLPAAATPSCR